MGFLENILSGMQISVIGLIAILLVLILLIVILCRLGKISRKLTRMSGPVAAAKKTEHRAGGQSKDDTELIAVLAAAVAAAMETSPSNVRISSYKKTTTRSAWANAGRREQIASRF